MLDLIQIKSWYDNANFKDDIKYVNYLIELRVHELDYNKAPEEKFNFEKEAEYIKLKSHSHLDISAISRITEIKINYWNSRLPSVKRNVSQYENDMSLINKKYVDDKFSQFNPVSIIIDCENFILNGLNNKKWLLTVDDNGILSTSEYIQEGE